MWVQISEFIPEKRQNWEKIKNWIITKNIYIFYSMLETTENIYF